MRMQCARLASPTVQLKSTGVLPASRQASHTVTTAGVAGSMIPRRSPGRVRRRAARMTAAMRISRRLRRLARSASRGWPGAERTWIRKASAMVAACCGMASLLATAGANQPSGAGPSVSACTSWPDAASRQSPTVTRCSRLAMLWPCAPSSLRARSISARLSSPRSPPRVMLSARS